MEDGQLFLNKKIIKLVDIWDVKIELMVEFLI